jgi:hypothetical protein
LGQFVWWLAGTAVLIHAAANPHLGARLLEGAIGFLLWGPWLALWWFQLPIDMYLALEKQKKEFKRNGGTGPIVYRPSYLMKYRR